MMVEISLRNYLKKVERLVQDEAWEEAIANSRQILNYYPRNAAAYRFLGQALVGQFRMDEAGEIFRRLLSAFPTDFIAHQNLSLVYEKLKQPDMALWHLERAFDAAPNDKNVVSRLRDLYAEYRGVKVDRLQLTAGAVAGQYISSGLYDQAIEVLQKALERTPDRVDLKLMLARSLWSSGQAVDAAEVAIEVLNVLPYTVAANRILTELWLNEQRPSDAQRYLSRIEDVDPYLAFRLATGENVPAETFMVQELDYDQYVQQKLTVQNPDWLERLEGEEGSDEFADGSDDWLKDIEPASPPPPPPNTTSARKITGTLRNMLPDNPVTSKTGNLAMDDENSLPADVLENIERMRGIASDATMAAPSPEAVQAALEGDDDDWMKVLQEDPADSAHERVHTGVTGLLASLKDEDEVVEEADDDNMNWLDDIEQLDARAIGDTSPLSAEAAAASGLFDSSPLTPMTPKSPNKGKDYSPTGLTDSLGDLTQYDSVHDADEQPNMTGLFDDTGSDNDDDGLSWLNDDDLKSDELPASDDRDSMEWMRTHDIEFDENAETPSLFDDPYGVEDDVALRRGSSDAWMAGSGIEFEDDSGLSDSSAIEEDEDADADGLAWMRGSGAELKKDSSKPTRPEQMKPAAQPEAETNYQVSDDSLLDEMFELERIADTSTLPDLDSAMSTGSAAGDDVADDDDELDMSLFDQDDIETVKGDAALFDDMSDDAAPAEISLFDDNEDADAAEPADFDMASLFDEDSADPADAPAMPLFDDSGTSDDDMALEEAEPGDFDMSLFEEDGDLSDVPDAMLLDEAPDEAQPAEMSLFDDNDMEDASALDFDAGDEVNELDDMADMSTLNQADVSALQDGEMADSSGDEFATPEAIPAEPVDWQETMPEEPQPWQQDDDGDSLDDMEWLTEDHGDNLVPQSELPSEEPDAAEDDSMAWLADDFVADDALEPGAADDEDASGDMSWLSGEYIADTTTEQPASENMADLFGDDEAAEDESFEWNEEAESDPLEPAFPARSGVTDWLTELKKEDEAEPAPISGGRLLDALKSDDELAAEESDSAFTWSDEIADDTGSELSDLPDAPSEDDAFDWGEAAAPEADDLPAWGSDLGDETPDAATGTEFDWGEEVADAEDAGWLSEISDVSDAEELPAASLETDEEAADESAGWLTEIDNAEELPVASLDTDEEADDAEGAGWLTEIDDAEEVQSPTPEWGAALDDAQPEAAGEEFAWGDELTEEGDELPLDATAEDEFAWGEELADEAASSDLSEADEFAEPSGADWLSDIGDPDEEEAAAPSAQSAVPASESFAWTGDEADLADPLAESEGFAWNDEIADDAGAEAPAEDVEFAPEGFTWGEEIADDGEALPEASTGDEFAWGEELPEDVAADEEALAEESPTPDWLSGLGQPEEDDAGQPVMSDAGGDEEFPVEDEFAWGDELPAEEGAADEELLMEESAGDAWLPEMSYEEEPPVDEFALPEDEPLNDDELAEMDEISMEDMQGSDADLDWMVDTDGGEEEYDEWQQEEYDSTPSPTAGMTGLLNSIESNRYESGEEASAEPGNVDWLSEVESESMADEQAEDEFPVYNMEQPDEPVIGDNFEWGSDVLNEAGDESEMEWLDTDAEGAGTDDSFNWEQEFADATGEHAAVEADAEWLNGIGKDTTTVINEADADAPFEWTDDENAEAAPDWLTQLDKGEEAPAEEEFAAPLPVEASTAEEDDDMEAEPAESFDFEPELDGEEDSAMLPATNAPDWLNAMVPGLDLDYEAREELPAAPESPAQGAPMRRKNDYAWVQQVVDEEEGEPAPATPTSTGRLNAVRKFVFSRLPSWIRPKESPAAMQAADVVAAGTGAAAVATATVPDYLMEEDAPAGPDDSLLDEPDFMDSLDSEFNADMPEDEFDDFGADFDDFDFDEPDEEAK